MAGAARGRTAASVGALLFALVALSPPSWASFTHQATASQSISTASVQPASSLSVSTSCSGILSFQAKAVLNWTATPSTFASGYVIERWKGATLQATVHVTPRTTTTYTDQPIATGTTFTWKVRAEIYLWTSTLIQANGTTPGLCL